MPITNINNSLIQISDPILANLDNIEYIDINVEHNCCSKYSQRMTIQDKAEYKLCSASYCNYNGQDQSCGDRFPQNCLHPQGSYYFKLSELVMTINGTPKNVLTRSYNLTQESEVELLKKIEFGGLELNFFVETSYTNQGYLCVSLSFIDLPSGVKPEYFILRNVESCFIKQDFNCLVVIPNNQCVEWYIKFEKDKIYQLDKLELLDGEEIQLDVELKLIDMSIESGSMYLLDELAPLLTDYTISYEEAETSFKLIFKEQVKHIYGRIDSIVNTMEFLCNRNTKIPTAITYSTLIDFTNHDAVYAINVENPLYVTPLNLLDYPILKSKVSTIIDVIKTKDSAVTGTIEYVSNNIYRITILTYTNPPTDIILHNNYTDYKAFGFVASKLSNIGSTYNSNLVEYIHNNLYIKPAFFTATDLFVDGIYSVAVDIVTASEIYSLKHCIFVFTNQCKINELYLKDKELGLKAMLLHTMLIENSNCGCDCSTSCLLYNDLHNLLYNSKCV